MLKSEIEFDESHLSFKCYDLIYDRYNTVYDEYCWYLKPVSTRTRFIYRTYKFRATVHTYKPY